MLGTDEAACEVSRIPTIAADSATMTNPVTRTRRMRTPDRRAASGLPPIAYMYRPSSVWSSSTQSTIAITAAIQIWLLSPRISPWPMST